MISKKKMFKPTPVNAKPSLQEEKPFCSLPVASRLNEPWVLPPHPSPIQPSLRSMDYSLYWWDYKGIIPVYADSHLGFDSRQGKEGSGLVRGQTPKPSPLYNPYI